MKAWQAESSLMVVTLIWGATFIFTKIGLNDVPPSLYIILRFTIALIICFLIFGKHYKKFDYSIIKQGLILGFLFGTGFLLQTYGLKYTTVSKSAFITGMTVPITPFVFYLVRKKPVALWSIIGVVISTTGLYIFTNPDFYELNYGDVFTLLSCFCWAFYITYMDVFTKHRNTTKESAQILMLQFVGALPLAIIAFFIFDYSTVFINPTANLLISLSFNAIMASFLVTFIHTSVQKFTTPVKAALIFSLEPIIASILSIFIMKEIFGFREYLGGAILLSGVMLSEIGNYTINLIRRILRLN